MKLFVIYDDALTASQEDMALKMLCSELQKMSPASLVASCEFDLQNPDIQTVLKAIKSEEKKLLKA